MATLNLVQVIGNITRDPELRYTPQGTAVTELSVAVNREYRKGEERMKDTTFVDVTAWQKLAEIVCEYLKKGSAVYVQGRLNMDQWEDKQTGAKRSKLKVVASDIQFLDKKGDAGEQHTTPPPQRYQQSEMPDKSDCPF